jgi:hypothetical protein
MRFVPSGPRPVFRSTATFTLAFGEAAKTALFAAGLHPREARAWFEKR